ncbi:hypothetical protein PAXRUDRAFT_828353, partial [Paxillus rubicundulus Ve08.2h10]
MVPSLLFVHLSKCELPVVKVLVIGNPTTPYYHTGLAYFKLKYMFVSDYGLDLR